MATDAIVTLSKLTYYDGKLKAWVTTELNEAIAGLGNIFTLKGSVDSVDALPATDNESGDIYIVGTAAPYDEYYWDGTKWELMGTTATDISGVVTKAALYEGADGTGTVAAPADGTIVKVIYDKITAVEKASVTAVVDATPADRTAATETETDVNMLKETFTYDIKVTKGDGTETTIEVKDHYNTYGTASDTQAGLMSAANVAALAKATTDITTINETLNNTVTESDIDSLFAGT